MATLPDHDWTFTAVCIGDSVNAVAICKRCGSGRREPAVRSGEPDRPLWLGGTCQPKTKADDPKTMIG